MSSDPQSGLSPAVLARRFRELSHFPTLDALRALAIIPVVFHHSTPRPLDGLLGRGPIGVDLFFAISGFLITTLLLRERQSYGRLWLFGFYARRALRIFPLYYLVLGLHVLYACLLAPERSVSQNFVPLIPFYATYTANLAAPLSALPLGLFSFGWSLCVEEQFYAWLAPLLRVTRRLSTAAMLIAAWLLVDLGLERTGIAPVPQPWLSVLVVLRSFATPIGCGALLALLAAHPKCEHAVFAWLGHPAAAPLSLLWVVGLILYPRLPLVALHLGLGLLVATTTLRVDHGLSWLLDRPVLAALGRISYGLYLWHVPILSGWRQLFPELTERPFLLFALGMPSSILVARLSYDLYEAWFLRLARRYRRPSPTPSLA